MQANKRLRLFVTGCGASVAGSKSLASMSLTDTYAHTYAHSLPHSRNWIDPLDVTKVVEVIVDLKAA